MTFIFQDLPELAVPLLIEIFPASPVEPLSKYTVWKRQMNVALMTKANE